jgi:Fe-S-cluster-containing dehydrogenase component
MAVRWGMVVDLDRCTGCQACVVACHAENNIALNLEDVVLQQRAMNWIRIERYWEGEYPNVKARFLPVLCQHCGNAPCEPVCPVYATYHSRDGLNVQVYNRCVGTRYCANNCPYHARFFNFWERENEVAHKEYLNPDVTTRSKGIMEKCTFCVQRIRKAERQAKSEGRPVKDGEIQPACVQACPTDALVFGNLADPDTKVARLSKNERHYTMLASLGTEPGVIYLKKVDPHAGANETTH